MALQGLRGLGSSAARRSGGLSAYGATPEEAEESLLSKIGGVTLGGLATIGNVLDLPGSIVRDLIAGTASGDWDRYNPFDQILSPFRSENRAEGRDVLHHVFGMRKNRETGLTPFSDPGEFGRDVAGFATEVLTDPLSFLTFGGSALTKTGKVAQKAGLTDWIKEAARNASAKAQRNVGVREFRTTHGIDDLLRAVPNPDEFTDALKVAAGGDDALKALLARNEPLGNTVGFALPFGKTRAGSNLGRAGAAYNRGADWLGSKVGSVAPTVFARGLFDSPAGGKFTPMGQEIAERDQLLRKQAIPKAREDHMKLQESAQPILDEFKQLFGDDILRKDYNPELDPRDLDPIIDRVFKREKELYESDPIGQITRQFRGMNPHIVQASRKDVDPSMIKDFDILLEQYNTATGRNLDEADFYDLFRQSDAPPTRESVRGMAEDELLYERDQGAAAIPGTDRFTPGDVVIAGDRGNYGYVQSIGPKSSRVFFRNPQTNAARTVTLPNDQLKKAFAGDSTEAATYADQVVRKVFDDVVQATGELGERGGGVQAAFDAILGKQVPDELGRKISQHVEDMVAANRARAESLKEQGYDMEFLRREGDEFGVEHVPRYTAGEHVQKLTGQRPNLQRGFGSMMARDTVTRDLPQFVVNEMHRGQKYRGQNGAENILKDFGEYLNPQYGQADDAFNPEALDLDFRAKHAQELADWLTGRKAGDLYTKEYADNFLGYQRGARIAGATADAVHDVLFRHARQDGQGVRLEAALKAAGLSGENALNYFAKRHGVDPNVLTVDPEIIQQITGVTKIQQSKPWAEAIGSAVDRFNNAFKTWVTVPFPGFAFRNHSSGQFVNLASGLVNDGSDLSRYGKSYRRMLSLQKTARENPGALSDADRVRLREMVAYDVIPQHGYMDIDLASAQPGFRGDPIQRIIPGAVLEGSNTLRTARTKVAENPLFARKRPENPRIGELGLRDRLNRAEKNELAALNIQDNLDAQAWKRTEGERTANKVLRPARVGAEIIKEKGTQLNSLVEWQNRGVMYDYLRESGWAPEAAAAKVKELQFDYGDLAPFEKDVMRRAMPFYAFTRKIVPMMIDTIRQRPGGVTSQTIRATKAGQNEQKPLPDWIAQGTAIPLGQKEDGSQSFLTGLGLAHEAPLQFLGGGVRGAGMETLGMLNPLLKGPLEHFTGESFFQRGPMGGRDIDTMDPTIGRILTQMHLRDEDVSGRAKPFISPLVENIASNSPMSRILTTVRTLLDERKYKKTAVAPGDALLTNLLTGARVSDVTPAAQDAVLRDLANATAMESGARSFQSVYFPQAMIEEMRATDPRRAEQMEAFNALRNLLARKAKARSSR